MNNKNQIVSKAVLKQQTTDKKFYQSQNFWTNVATIVFMIAALFGLDFGEVDPEQIGEAILNENWLLLITAAWNMVNIIIKFARSKKPKEDVAAIVESTVAEVAEKYLRV